MVYVYLSSKSNNHTDESREFHFLANSGLSPLLSQGLQLVTIRYEKLNMRNTVPKPPFLIMIMRTHI